MRAQREYYVYGNNIASLPRYFRKRSKLETDMATSAAVQCSLCAFVSPSVARHISHVHLVHSSDVPFEIKYEIETCDKAFSAFSAFSSHVYRYHRLAMGLETVGIQHPDEYGSNVQIKCRIYLKIWQSKTLRVLMIVVQHTCV